MSDFTDFVKEHLRKDKEVLKRDLRSQKFWFLISSTIFVIGAMIEMKVVVLIGALGAVYFMFLKIKSYYNEWRTHKHRKEKGYALNKGLTKLKNEIPAKENTDIGNQDMQKMP